MWRGEDERRISSLPTKRLCSKCAGAGVMYDMYVCAGLLQPWLLFSDNIIGGNVWTQHPFFRGRGTLYKNEGEGKMLKTVLFCIIGMIERGGGLNPPLINLDG